MNIELNKQQIDLILYTLKLHKAICKVSKDKEAQREAANLFYHIAYEGRNRNQPEYHELSGICQEKEQITPYRV